MGVRGGDTEGNIATWGTERQKNGENFIWRSFVTSTRRCILSGEIRHESRKDTINTCKSVVGKPEEKGSCVRSRCTRQGNSKQIFDKTGCQEGD